MAHPFFYLPFPIFDDARPGHYMTAMFDIENDDLRKIVKPPSCILKNKFSELGGLIADETLQSISKEVNLPVEEVSIWFDRLRTVLKNCQRGARSTHRRRQLTGHAEKSRIISVNVRQGKQQRDEVSKNKTDQQVREQETTPENDACFCGSCGRDYFDSSNSNDNFWVGCDLCDRWYCATCEGPMEEPTTDTYLCTKCIAT